MENTSVRDEVKLVVGKEDFICSKTHLSRRSEYFRAMFSDRYSERDKREIVLNDVDEEAFRFILEENTVSDSVDCDLIIEILKVSSMLQFNKEIEEYENYIITSDFLKKRPFSLMAISSRLGRANLLKKTSAYCLWNFKELKSSNDFLNMTFHDLSRYLDDERLHVEKEFVVFEGIKHWSNQNNPKEDIVILLMKTVRYKSLTLNELEEISKTPFIRKIDFMKKIFSHESSKVKCENRIVGFDYSSISDGSDSGTCSCQSDKYLLNYLREVRGQKARVEPTAATVVIHKTDNFPSLYNFCGDRLKLILTFREKPFGKTFVGYRMIAVGFKIYLLGGEHGFGHGMFNTQVWSYDLISQAYHFESLMLQQRRHFYTAAFGQWIFVIGGTGKHRRVLDNIEKFNIHTKEWFDCTGLNQKTIEAVCSYKEKIYIASRIIYVYDPSTNTFENIAITLPLYGVSFIAIRSVQSKLYLYAIDRKDSNIFRWQLDPNGSAQHVGKFIQNGESICIDNYIYNLSCKDSDTVCVEKFCLTTFYIQIVELFNDVGEFECKHIGCFQIPNYF